MTTITTRLSPFLSLYVLLSSLVLLVPISATAELILRSSFEEPVITPQFPLVDGEFQLPPGPTTNQLEWILEQLALSDTSLAEINQRFDPAWLASISAEQTRSFIAAVRADYPSARIVDVVAVTPVSVVVVIQGQDATANRAFLSLEARYTGGQRIIAFGVNFYGGTLQFPADQNLTLDQAADKFTTLAADTGLLVARIDDNGVCQPIIERNASTLRATGSIFKTWVLGGAAEAIASGMLQPDDPVTLVASERVFGGSLINREPNGTIFPLQDLATLMIGISDNTATDLVHEITGRTVINNYIDDSGVNDADVLKPILSVNEQFHLFFSFPLSTALQYVNGAEPFQETFLQNQIVPLGPVTSFPFANDSLFTAGSWSASPLDICANLARLRDYPSGSDARLLVDAAMGAQVAQSEVRNAWDRSWYKGGSLVSATTGYHVLTHAWLLEDDGQQPFVVVGMTNDANGGIDQNSGIFNVQSVLARILELTAAGL
ncbi:MAG: hypothetical protein Tsb002_35800 [Wenzhouxiangellaceae bacterium]